MSNVGRKQHKQDVLAAAVLLDNLETQAVGKVVLPHLEELGISPLSLEVQSACQRLHRLTQCGLDPLQHFADAVKHFDEYKVLFGASPSVMPARNEPCVCGSGLKFKKCCMPLIRDHT